jgi:hypothetical protein
MIVFLKYATPNDSYLELAVRPPKGVTVNKKKGLWSTHGQTFKIGNTASLGREPGGIIGVFNTNSFKQIQALVGTASEISVKTRGGHVGG